MEDNPNNVNLSSLLRQRIIVLRGEITDKSAQLVIAQLLFLNREDSQARIQLYIKPSYGKIYLLKAIQDTVRQTIAPISTIAFEYTNSFSTAILTEGDKGMRYARPHSEIELYQPEDLPQILRDDLIKTYVRRTHQDYDTIKPDIDARLLLSPQDAIEYGLIDSIID
jgi:ATP-dependent Clp protease, protease subunit